MHQEYAVGWGTLILINANIAQCKNRSGFVWGFLSIFLGPVCTFILCLVDKGPGRD